MTPEQIEQHRKRFEVHFSNQFSFTYDADCAAIDILQNGTVLTTWYCDGYPEDCFAEFKSNLWHGYLLCAENIEVELPDKENDDNLYFRDGFNIALDLTRDKLESQGLKVKP